MEFTKKGCNWNWGFREAWLGKTVSDNWIFSECETDNGSLVEQLSYIGANAEQIMDISSASFIHIKWKWHDCTKISSLEFSLLASLTYQDAGINVNVRIKTREARRYEIVDHTMARQYVIVHLTMAQPTRCRAQWRSSQSEFPCSSGPARWCSETASL